MTASETPAVAAASSEVPDVTVSAERTPRVSVDKSYDMDAAQEKHGEAFPAEQQATSRLEPPAADENHVSGASSITDISIEKPAGTYFDGSELSKPKTATSSEGKEGVNLHKTRTNVTLASLRDQLPHSFKLAAIVVALALSIFLVSLDMTIVSTAIPRITDEFHSLPVRTVLKC